MVDEEVVVMAVNKAAYLVDLQEEDLREVVVKKVVVCLGEEVELVELD